MQCFSVIKKLLDTCGGGFGDSYIRHWVAIVELYKEVIIFHLKVKYNVIYICKEGKVGCYFMCDLLSSRNETTLTFVTCRFLKTQKMLQEELCMSPLLASQLLYLE